MDNSHIRQGKKGKTQAPANLHSLQNYSYYNEQIRVEAQAISKGYRNNGCVGTN
jgi:hypothetical protein